MGSGIIGRLWEDNSEVAWAKVFFSSHSPCHSRVILPTSSYHATTHATPELFSQSLPIMPLPMLLQSYPPKVFLSYHYPCYSRVILPKSSYHATTHATPELSSQILWCTMTFTKYLHYLNKVITLKVSPLELKWHG
jgi:hypothetical protein